MNECWYALALAMMSKVYLTPEKAFWFLSKGEKPKNSNRSERRNELTLLDVQDMAKLKETMSYKAIGEIYGMKADAVYNRIRRLKGVI